MPDDPAVEAAELYREVADRLTALTVSVRDLTARFAEVKKYGRTNRHLIWWTFVSIALDIALSAAVIAVTAGQAHSNDSFRKTVVATSSLRAANLKACANGNKSRAEEKAIWNTILAQPNATALYSTLKREVAVAYGPRNCTALYGGK